jgi:hypothetical protein
VEWRARQLPAPAAGEPPRPTEQLLTELYVAGLVDLCTLPGTAAATAGDRPEAFAAARWINREHDVMPNLYHEALRLQDPSGRKLLDLLDGTRTREDLLAAIGAPLAGPDGRAQLEKALDVLAKKALLVG